MRKTWKTVAAVSVLLLAACSGEERSDEAAPPVPVETSMVARGDLEEIVEIAGSLVAGRSVRVFGQVPDRLIEVLVDVGDRVRQGQVLARIRSDGLRASVEQVEANLRAVRASHANLQEELARTQRLFAEGAVSRQALEALQAQTDGAQAQVEQLEAALTQTRVGLQNATITAPFGGLVATRYQQAGDMVAPGMPILELVDPSRMLARGDVSQEQLGRVEVGMRVHIVVPTRSGPSFEGRVTRLSPTLDPASRMASIEAEAANPEGFLRSGMFVNLRIVTHTAESALLVPIQALVEEYRYLSGDPTSAGGPRGRAAQVYVADGETAVLKPVRVGLVGRERVQVLEGLSEGERVITTGKHQLTDGARIRVDTGSGSAGGPAVAGDGGVNGTAQEGGMQKEGPR